MVSEREYRTRRISAWASTTRRALSLRLKPGVRLEDVENVEWALAELNRQTDRRLDAEVAVNQLAGIIAGGEDIDLPDLIWCAEAKQEALRGAQEALAEVSDWIASASYRYDDHGPLMELREIIMKRRNSDG